ncbi:HAD hydrolase family protein [Streptomyces somaliensis]|nr:HAD hydrolase family protein [Streptomyces somaliensis]
MCGVPHVRALEERHVRDNGHVTSPTTSPSSRPTSRWRPRLIATDLDGTLLRNDKSVSDRTVAALAAAEEAGIEVFFVTGRPARWMSVVSEHVHGHGLAICSNGAAVVDLHSGGGSSRCGRWSGRPRTTSSGPCAGRPPARPSRWSSPTASATSRTTRPSTWTPPSRSVPPRNCSTRRCPAPGRRC